MGKKSLLYICSWYLDRPDGMNRKIAGQLQALKKMFEVTCVYPYWASRYLERLLNILLFQVRVLRDIRNFDLIYYRYGSYVVLVNLYLIVCGRKELYLEINTSPVEMAVNGNYFQFLLSLFFDRLLFSRAVKIIVVTPELKEIVERKVSGVSVEIMRNGYFKEETHISPSPDIVSFVRDVREVKDSLLSVMVSSVQPWHGLDKIVQIVASLDHVYLAIVGEGRERVALEKLVQDQSLDRRVFFFGFREVNDLQYLYENADFAFASFAPERANLTELSPLKVGEYLTYGLPTVIAFNNVELEDQVFVHRYRDNDGLKVFLSRLEGIDRSRIIAFAEQNYSWDLIFGQLLVV